ncbi:hypothetical protein AB4232_17565 [Vibrio sp. 10N.286.46.A8]|uniref:hypothetical protein n=1 Tax=Vibrio sp. 10N.286.46.A8 TaxID=3229697 RepID=UPI00355445D6
MSEQNFLCTYSVKTREQETLSEEKQAQGNADRIRRDIKDLDEWDNVEDIETTFTGCLNLSGSIAQKRSEAKSIIKSKMREIVDDYDAYCDVDIECAFMVDGLGKIIKFSI